MQYPIKNFALNASLEALTHLSVFEDLAKNVPRSVAQYLLQQKKAKHPTYPNSCIAVGRADLLQIIDKFTQTGNGRLQILYYTGPTAHAYMFDLEKNNAGISICCLESMYMTDPQEVLQLIKKNLDENKITNTIYYCECGLQRDNNNCAFFSYIFMSQLGKQQDFHQYLASKQFPPPQKTKYINVEGIIIVPLAFMPEKIHMTKQEHATIRNSYVYNRRRNNVSKLKGQSKEIDALITAVLKEREDRYRKNNPILDFILRTRNENKDEKISVATLLQIIEMVENPSERFRILEEAADFVLHDSHIYVLPPTRIDKKSFSIGQIQDLLVLKLALLNLHNNNLITVPEGKYYLLDIPIRELLEKEIEMKSVDQATQKTALRNSLDKNNNYYIQLLELLYSLDNEKQKRFFNNIKYFTYVKTNAKNGLTNIQELFAQVKIEDQLLIINLIADPSPLTLVACSKSLRTYLLTNTETVKDFKDRINFYISIINDLNQRANNNVVLPRMRDLVTLYLRRDVKQEDINNELDQLKNVTQLTETHLQDLYLLAIDDHLVRETRTYYANLYVRYHLLAHLLNKNIMLFNTYFSHLLRDAANSNSETANNLKVLYAFKSDSVDEFANIITFLFQVPESNTFIESVRRPLLTKWLTYYTEVTQKLINVYQPMIKRMTDTTTSYVASLFFIPYQTNINKLFSIITETSRSEDKTSIEILRLIHQLLWRAFETEARNENQTFEQCIEYLNHNPNENHEIRLLGLFLQEINNLVDNKKPLPEIFRTESYIYIRAQIERKIEQEISKLTPT